MYPRLCLILSLILSGESILPNGVHVYELPGNANSFEVIAGYRTGIRTETVGGIPQISVVSSFLKSTPSARAMAVAAYGAGGEIEFFSDADRVGLRLKMPTWARPMVEASIAEFLSETPSGNPELVDRALEEVRSQKPSEQDVRARVEEQFRTALLGPGEKSDSEKPREAVEQFFTKYYGTDRAFVVWNAEPSISLSAIPRRNSSPVSREAGTDLINGGRRGAASLPTTRIQTDLDEGALILGVPVPSIYYRNWYAFLMLDRLIQQNIPQKPRSMLLPSLEPYYYRMEVAVPSGQTAEGVETSLHQSLDQLQYVQPSSEQLEAARSSALQYLESDSVVKWFLSMGVPERRAEGVEWVRSFSADDIRSAARDLVESNPVIASWSPKVKSLRLDVESLSDIAARASNPPSKTPPPLAALGSVRLIPFPPHTDKFAAGPPPARLDSGVSVVSGSKYAVFVAPDSLQVFDREPDPDLIQVSFGTFRSSRILVMAPPEAIDRVKQQWSRFQGNVRDETSTPVAGNITSADIPALLVLKMLLDRRLVEAGIWNETQLGIRASEGSTLTIHGSEASHKLVLEWIRELASRPIPEADLDWAREAALHRLPELQSDIQSLIWEWNPDGVIMDFHFVPASQIQDVARIYLQ